MHAAEGLVWPPAAHVSDGDGPGAAGPQAVMAADVVAVTALGERTGPAAWAVPGPAVAGQLACLFQEPVPTPSAPRHMSSPNAAHELWDLGSKHRKFLQNRTSSRAIIWGRMEEY